MRALLVTLPLLFLVACSTTPKPNTGPYASMDCAALETERLRLVAELDGLPAVEAAKIEETRLKIEAVGVAQVEKGCAG